MATATLCIGRGIERAFMKTGIGGKALGPVWFQLGISKHFLVFSGLKPLFISAHQFLYGEKVNVSQRQNLLSDELFPIYIGYQITPTSCKCLIFFFLEM